MPIEFRCNQCGQMLRVAEASAGKSARCPGCKTIMVVPAASDLAARSLSPLSQPVSQQAPAAAPTPPTAQPTQQDALFEYLKQATTPVGAAAASVPQPAPAQQPAPYQQPGLLPNSGAFADPPSKNPFSESHKSASINPYESFSGGAHAGFGPATEERPGLPWEVRGGSLATWWETSQLCLGDAERAFHLMRRTGGIGSPFMFAVLGLLVGLIASLVWSLPALVLQVVAAQGQGNQMGAWDVVGSLVLQVLYVVYWATAGLFISATLTHLCLMLVGGAGQGFESSFRVTAFTLGSIAWLYVVPCFGPLIVLVMWYVCRIQGLAQAHETTAGRAAAGVFLPVVAGLLLCGAAVVAVVAGIWLANQ